MIDISNYFFHPYHKYVEIWLTKIKYIDDEKEMLKIAENEDEKFVPVWFYRSCELQVHKNEMGYLRDLEKAELTRIIWCGKWS